MTFEENRVTQEPNQSREPEPSEPFFPKPEAEPEPPPKGPKTEKIQDLEIFKRD